MTKNYSDPGLELILPENSGLQQGSPWASSKDGNPLFGNMKMVDVEVGWFLVQNL